jgi:hypothetical protein
VGPLVLIYQHRTTHRDKLIADEISRRSGRAQAIGQAAGRRQEEAFMTPTLFDLYTLNSTLDGRRLAVGDP